MTINGVPPLMLLMPLMTIDGVINGTNVIYVVNAINDNGLPHHVINRTNTINAINAIKVNVKEF